MNLFTMVARLGEPATPFFAWADRVYAKCERFCKKIEAADAEKDRREARLRDFEQTLEEAERWN